MSMILFEILTDLLGLLKLLLNYSLRICEHVYCLNKGVDVHDFKINFNITLK
jgi:hypothetical protein